MARKPSATRSIKLPGAPNPVAPRRPTAPTEPAASDESGLMRNLEANVEVRDRSQLPSKVKVITPQVIMNIVKSVTDRFGESVDRGELDQLVMENTQFRMQLEQTGEKLEQYKGEYKKVFERLQQAQQLMQKQGQGDESVRKYYEEQLADMQQRNANAVDIYTGLQQQLDETLAQFDQLQAEVNRLNQALADKEEEGARLAGQAAAAEGAAHAHEELEQARGMVVDLRTQLEEAMGRAAETEEKLSRLEAERPDLETQAKSAKTATKELEELRENLKKKDAEIGRLDKELRQNSRSSAKMDNIEVELEKLRNAEGQWLEEKRRMAAQLNNETETRRQLEAKLAGAGGGGLSDASKKLAERATQAEDEANEARAELERVKRELDKARAKAGQADAGAAEAEKLKAELKAAQDEVRKAQDEAKKATEAAGKAGQTAKELAALNRKYENVETELEALRNAEGKLLEEKRRMAAQLSNETNLRRELEEKLKMELADEKGGRESDKKKIAALQAAAETASKAEEARAAAERSLGVVEEELEKLRKDRDNLRGRYDALKSGGDKVNALSGQLEETRRNLQDAERKLAARHEHVAKLATELDSTRTELERVRKDLVEAQKPKGQTRIAQAESGLKEAQAQRDQAVAEAKALQTAKAQLAGEVESLRRKLKDANEDETQTSRENVERINRLEKNIAENAALRESAEKRADESAKRLRDAQNDIAAGKASLESARKEAEQARKDAAKAAESAKAIPELEKEVAVLKQKLAAAEARVGEKTAVASADMAAIRNENEGLNAKVAELQKAREVAEQARAEAQSVAGQVRGQLEAAQQKAEKATEQRFEAEKQLVELRTRADAEKRNNETLSRRVQQLEEDLKRERKRADSAAPAEAVQNLNMQLDAQKTRHEAEQERARAAADELHKRLAEAELRESELAAQLEGIEQTQQDAIRAKAVAGQRRAQIERMQSDVESARRQVKESEAYWKGEMEALSARIHQHLESAEKGEEGADQRLVKLLEEHKVGVFDKYAKLRAKHNRTEKELEDAREHLGALERILAKREGEEKKLRTAMKKTEGERKPAKGRKKK